MDGGEQICVGYCGECFLKNYLFCIFYSNTVIDGKGLQKKIQIEKACVNC